MMVLMGGGAGGFKVDVGAWWHEKPRRTPAAYACALAAANVLPRDERLFLETSPDVEEIASELLRLETELAHALLLVLHVLPPADRRAFAAAFYSGRRRPTLQRPRAPNERLRVAGTAAHLVFELVGSRPLRHERIRDLLVGATQDDDLSRTPEPAVAELRRAVAAARREVASADPFEASTAATLAVLEVLDPASGDVALQVVLLRSTWAALRSWAPSRVAEFLRVVDAAFEPRAPA
jgi:phytoene dehydrogenase-like protein